MFDPDLFHCYKMESAGEIVVANISWILICYTLQSNRVQTKNKYWIPKNSKTLNLQFYYNLKLQTQNFLLNSFWETDFNIEFFHYTLSIRLRQDMTSPLCEHKMLKKWNHFQYSKYFKGVTDLFDLSQKYKKSFFS